MKNKLQKIPKQKSAIVAYEFSGDLKQFRLVAEPTADAIKNDVQKFYDVSIRGTDMVLLGRFLLGVSLIKLKKIVGNAKRGAHGAGDSGWMNFKKENFPNCANTALTEAANFANEIFTIWQDSLISNNGKLRNLEIKSEFDLDPLSFQLPENPDELRGLLTAIRDSMDGKKMTAFCRAIGRIRDAIAPGANSKGSKKLTDEQKELLDPLLEIENDLVSLSSDNDLTFGDCDSVRLARFERVLRVCLDRVKTIIAARKKS